MKKKLKRLSLIVTTLLTVPLIGMSNSNNQHGNADKAIIHFYRPDRAVGFGWVFNIKANGSELVKLKNGKHVILEMDPSEVNFQLKKNEIPIQLEPGKHYYLRASLTRNMLLGKPELVEVTESFAKSEL